jgi:hypothetical protein
VLLAQQFPHARGSAGGWPEWARPRWPCCCSSGPEVHVFEQSVPLAAGKTVEAVTLPSLGSVVGDNAALHIFAMTVG